METSLFQPKVTIMVPTYNQDKFICQNVESALNQSYSNLEVVVSNDNSSDNTEEVLKKYLSNPKFRYSRNSTNLGRVGNYRHTLYNLATGEWVLNLDGDDYLTDPDYIKQAVEQINFNRDNNIVMVAAAYSRLLPSGIAPKPDYYYKIQQDIILFKGLDIFMDPYNSAIGHLTCLYKRELALKLNFYSLNILQADSESILRLVLYGNVVFFKKSVAVWRLHTVNASTYSDVQQYIDSMARIEICVKEAWQAGVEPALIRKWEKKMYETQMQIIFRRIYWTKDTKHLKWMWHQYKQGKFRLHSIFYEVGNIRKLFALILYVIIKKTTTFLFGKPKGLGMFENR